MQDILKKIEELKSSKIKKRIDKRIKEFEHIKKEELFNELSFCLLTANFDAERAIKIQNEIKDGFLKLTEDELVKKLKQLGYRFPNTRAKYIVEARKHTIKSEREWLVKNIKGIGYKEASHFLTQMPVVASPPES